MGDITGRALGTGSGTLPAPPGRVHMARRLAGQASELLENGS